MTKSIYIAGPMSGLPEMNYPEFMAAEEALKALGWEVFNPARNPHVPDKYDFEFKPAYLWDIEHVIKADAIYMLQGWEKGAGARGEHAVAQVMKRHNPNYRIFYEQCLVPNRQPEERTNSEASSTPTGREQTYGGL